jgi:hypothetical protein
MAPAGPIVGAETDRAADNANIPSRTALQLIPDVSGRTPSATPPRRNKQIRSHSSGKTGGKFNDNLNDNRVTGSPAGHIEDGHPGHRSGVRSEIFLRPIPSRRLRATQGCV